MSANNHSDYNLFVDSGDFIMNRWGGTPDEEINTKAQEILGQKPRSWWAGAAFDLKPWQQVSGQDQHSIWLDKGQFTAHLEENLNVTVKQAASMGQVRCPPIQGLSHDYFGQPLTGNIVPGPFQSQTMTARSCALWQPKFELTVT